MNGDAHFIQHVEHQFNFTITRGSSVYNWTFIEINQTLLLDNAVASHGLHLQSYFKKKSSIIIASVCLCETKQSDDKYN